jgi:hypothetical protein
VLWSLAYCAILIGFGVACLYSVRQACVAGLEMWKSVLSSQNQDQINYLRGQIASLQTQLLAVQHPQVQARLESQAQPARPYDRQWDAHPQRPRNPNQFVGPEANRTPEIEYKDTVPKLARQGVQA